MAGENRFDPKRVTLPTLPQTGKGLTACYARSLGECSSQISAEHYISENILRSIGAKVTVGGTPFLIPKELPTGRMVSKILCTVHNNALASIDNVGGSFFRAIAKAESHLTASGDPVNTFTLVNGHDWELWLLKTLLGLRAMSGAEPEPKLVEHLFGGWSFLPPSGLYMRAYVGEMGDTKNLLNATVLTQDGAPAGFQFTVHGFVFALSLNGGFSLPGGGARYRPQMLQLRHGDRSAYLFLGWSSGRYKDLVIADWKPGQ